MSETTSERERGRDFERLLTFVDAIVAIAITLLVLPLVDLAREVAGGGSVRHLLWDHKAPIWAFFLSFLVIARLWLVQHRMLRHVVADDDRLTQLLLAWSLTIVLLPFPTALVSAAGGTSGQTTTKVFYVGTMAVSSLVLSLLSREVARHPELCDGVGSTDPMRSFATFAAFVLALAVMLLLPATSYWPLLLLAVSDRVVGLWRRRDGAGG